MKFKIGDRVAVDIAGTPKGRIVTGYDGMTIIGDPSNALPVQQSYLIYGETSYAVMNQNGLLWVAQESLIRHDNFLTRLFHAQQIDPGDQNDAAPIWP